MKVSPAQVYGSNNQTSQLREWCQIQGYEAINFHFVEPGESYIWGFDPVVDIKVYRGPPLTEEHRKILYNCRIIVRATTPVVHLAQ